MNLSVWQYYLYIFGVYINYSLSIVLSLPVLVGVITQVLTDRT
jgi:hypothetical protein